MIRFIAFDLDGTLLNSEGQISPYTKEVLLLKHNVGLKYIFASGRHYHEIIPIIQALGIHAGYYVVACDGQYIYSEKKELLYVSEFLKYRDIRRMNKTVKGKYSVITDRGDFFCKRKKGVLKNIFDYSQYRDLKKSKIEKVIIPGKSSREMCSSSIIQQYSVHLLIDRVEIKAKNVNKYTAIRWISQNYGFTLEELLYFGDEINDIECFSYLPYCIAPDNAVEEIRRKAKFITKSNDDDGIAKALLDFIR